MAKQKPMSIRYRILLNGQWWVPSDGVRVCFSPGTSNQMLAKVFGTPEAAEEEAVRHRKYGPAVVVEFEDPFAVCKLHHDYEYDCPCPPKNSRAKVRV